MSFNRELITNYDVVFCLERTYTSFSCGSNWNWGCSESVVVYYKKLIYDHQLRQFIELLLSVKTPVLVLYDT